jgi:hypothetical protein
LPDQVLTFEVESQGCRQLAVSLLLFSNQPPTPMAQTSPAKETPINVFKGRESAEKQSSDIDASSLSVEEPSDASDLEVQSHVLSRNKRLTFGVDSPVAEGSIRKCRPSAPKKVNGCCTSTAPDQGHFGRFTICHARDHESPGRRRELSRGVATGYSGYSATQKCRNSPNENR